MPNYGVIDLGSNTIRLVIYQVKDDCQPTYSNKDFKSLISDKVMAGLSAYVQNNMFSTAGIERAVGVLKGHAKRARYFNCKRLDVFATAVLRNAINGQAAIKEIEQRTGLSIVLLSAHEEAHLGFRGASCDRPIERATLIDIGGGSTELTCVTKGCDLDEVSIGQGSLSSFARHVQCILPTASEMDAIANEMATRVRQLVNPEIYHCDVLYGIGGSIRAAAKVQQLATHAEIRPKTMTKQEIHAILNWCRDDAASFAHTALQASAERIHTLVPGCVILSELFEAFKATTLELCRYGVREGYLIERMLYYYL